MPLNGSKRGIFPSQVGQNGACFLHVKRAIGQHGNDLVPILNCRHWKYSLHHSKSKERFLIFLAFFGFFFSGTNLVPSPDRRYWHIQDISSPNGSAISDSPSAYHRKYRILDLKIQNPIFFVWVSTQHSPFPDEFEAGFFSFKSSKLTETLATGKITFTRSCCKSA